MGKRKDVGTEGRALTATDGDAADTQQSQPMTDEEYEAYRKRMEPVAPWNRKDIPDYGPLKDRQHVFIFLTIGILATIGYEATTYFDQIDRWLAYLAIWFPLWFRLLSRVSPAESEAELEKKEREEFQKELERIAKEAEGVDE